MMDEIIKGIKYRLNEEALTAEVIRNTRYEGDIIIPETVAHNEISYRVTSIGRYAFDGCSYLTSIVIPDGVMSIGESAFTNCSSLTSIVIPDSVNSIGEFAFHGCSSLTSIVIPDGVTSIGCGAFKDCSSLKTISYNGTVAQWKENTLGKDWNSGIPAKVVHCTDGDVEI